MYIFIYSFFAKEQGGMSAPVHPENGEVCTRGSVGNGCFRRRAELDRRACTRSCSSDTDSRCRLHRSRLTGRDYYKGGWRDVRIYSGQGMRRNLYATLRPESQPGREKEILFNSTSNFCFSTCSPPSASFTLSLLQPVLQNLIFLRFQAFTRQKSPARNTTPLPYPRFESLVTRSIVLSKISCGLSVLAIREIVSIAPCTGDQRNEDNRE